MEAQEIQGLVMNDMRNPKTTPAARAQLARAWEAIEERKRILRGRPLPGSLKPEPKKAKPKPLPAITDEP